MLVNRFEGLDGVFRPTAARARELVDHGTPIEAACRIVILEDQLEEAQRINAEYRRAAESANPTIPA